VSAARFGYTLLVVLAMPFAAMYLLWRSLRQPAYRAHWGERFGWARYPTPVSPVIWVHAVSVGETRAAAPLMDALLARYPQHQFLLTHMTPTGRATGAEIVARWPGRVMQAYLPYDMPFAVWRLLRAFKPIVGIGMETETWPNLLAAAHSDGIPMVLVNARLSEKSLAKARRAPRLIGDAARSFHTVLAQTEADAARIRTVGVQQVEVTGNLKFDITADEAQVKRGEEFRRAAGARSVLLFASTREGEEALLLAALAQAIPAARLDPLLVFVPRHPQRFDEVARLIVNSGRALARRSNLPDWSAAPTTSDAAVLLGDTMGEMAMYYASCDIAFVGGSLLPLGGQNLIEACAVGTPVVVGPHTYNFAQATDDALAAGAAQRVDDAVAAVREMQAITSDAGRLRRMREAALLFSRQHRGATARAVARIAPLVDAAGQSSVAQRF
jgi:3-deoxy-D-manno-octulosonic-acid transferase